MVTCWKPSSSCIIPDIFGIGYGYLTKFVFKFLKSDTIRTVPFGFGMMKVGLAHALQDALSSIPKAIIRCISLYTVWLCIWGTGKGLLCTGSVFGLTSTLIGGTLNSPKLPSN